MPTYNLIISLNVSGGNKNLNKTNFDKKLARDFFTSIVIIVISLLALSILSINLSMSFHWDQVQNLIWKIMIDRQEIGKPTSIDIGPKYCSKVFWNKKKDFQTKTKYRYCEPSFFGLSLISAIKHLIHSFFHFVVSHWQLNGQEGRKKERKFNYFISKHFYRERFKLKI